MNLYILKFRLLQHGQVAVQAKDPTEAHRLMELAWRRKYGDFPSPVKSYEVIADDGDTSGTWLIAAPPADAEKDARIAALERKLAELTAAAEALLSHNGYGSPENRNQHFELQAKLRAVLDAQRGEKKEAKP